MYSPLRPADPLTPSRALAPRSAASIGAWSAGRSSLSAPSGLGLGVVLWGPGRAALSLEAVMREGERFNVSGFADLVGDDDGVWRELGYTSPAAMSVAMLLDDVPGAPHNKRDALTLALCQLERSQAEAVVVALARWAETRRPLSGERAYHPTIGELRQQIDVLGSLPDPLAAHDAAALRLLAPRLEAL